MCRHEEDEYQHRVSYMSKKRKILSTISLKIMNCSQNGAPSLVPEITESYITDVIRQVSKVSHLDVNYSMLHDLICPIQKKDKILRGNCKTEITKAP